MRASGAHGSADLASLPSSEFELDAPVPVDVCRRQDRLAHQPRLATASSAGRR